VTGGSRPTLRMRAEASNHRYRESLFLLRALLVVGGVGLGEAAGAVHRARAS
jgi:hypothetical protein